MVNPATTPSGSDRLRAKCNKALKEERKTELRLEAAHNNVKKLRRHCKTLKETSATDKTATADAFLAFAQNECLKLCTRVYKVFPREIRDTIYSYITGHEEVNVSCDADPWGDFTPVKYTIGQLDVFSSLSARTTDHWWKPEHVGPETVREIGENFYRSSCFVFHNNLAAVGPFRATDIWGLGFLPVNFVSKVEVSVNCSEYKFELLDRAGINTAPNQPSSRASYKTKERRGKSIYHTQNYLLVQLESLFGFKHGTALTIRISSHDREERSTLEQQEWMSHHVVPVILPILQRLKEAGCRVRLLLSVDTVWGFQRFTSKWNEVCLEAITKDFWEYVDVEQKRRLQAELDAESIEDSDDDEPSYSNVSWDVAHVVSEPGAADAWGLEPAWGWAEAGGPV